MVDPYGWSELDRTALNIIRERLRSFESMTWNEILVQAHRQNHLVSIERLCKEARDRLEENRQSDIAELVSLRVGGGERVWGILDGSILKLLWWDPEHAVCPSLKKGT